ncbi:MAG TPA: adenylate/guanylate cyclase domain-containing protein [Rhodanobacteraceae bacterium]|nr:adenylate/guanylate cyclase domain-containing protein [Rhodanobacteraceae bacterium]
MQAPPIQYARTPRGDIAYRVMGEGPADLLLVNPMSRSIETLWDYPANAALLQRLAGFSRVIVFDRRGSGISDPLPADLPPTWEDWIEDMLAVLDHVGITSATLLAERDAAAAALLFASSHPRRVRALLLCNTSARFRVAPGYPCGENHERSERLSQAWDQTWGTEQMVATTRPTLAGDPEYVRWVTRMQRVAYSPRRAGAEFRYIINFDARAVLPSIRAPTLILHRRDFAVIPQAHAFYLAEHIAGSRLELLPGGDMDVLLPGDERPLELIESFLANVRPAEGGERALATVLRMRVASSQQAAANLGGRRWHETQDSFRAIVRAELSRFQGLETDNDGTGFLVSFDGPARALRFASSVRQAARDQLRLEIRVGLHIGECQRVGDTLAGTAVEVGAGVLQATQAGEILATAAVRELVAGSGLELRSIGAHALDGVAGKWELYALES